MAPAALALAVAGLSSCAGGGGDAPAPEPAPFDHRWQLATRLHEVAPQEMQRRWSEALAG